MNKYLLSALIFVVCVSSCKKKDDPDPLDEVPPHNFITQNMKGKIGGKAWEFESGHKVVLSGGPSTMFYFKLSDTVNTTADSCNYYGYGDYKLALALNGNALETKVYGIAPHLHTAQFIYPFSPEIKGTGAIEILSIDNINKTITGRIDVTADANNTLNGNFKVYICQ